MPKADPPGREICSAHPEDTHPAKTRDKLGIGRHIRIVHRKVDPPQAGNSRQMKSGPGNRRTIEQGEAGQRGGGAPPNHST
jgi:hypothetical protein